MGEPSLKSGQVTHLYRYPVKGLSAEPLEYVDVRPGETFPADRKYAIANGPGRFDPDAPRPLPKINFLMLMRDEKLATLQTALDSADRDRLTIHRHGKKIVSGQLQTAVGRQNVEQFFAAFMKESLRGAPKIVVAPGHTFSDVAAHCVHIVNLATVRDMERLLGRHIDPLRFRANIYIDGLAPWSEFDWLDRTVPIEGPDGTVTFDIWARTQRCDATHVDPTSGVRDIAVSAAIQRAHGHTDLGVYATITTPGRLKIGDQVGRLSSSDGSPSSTKP